MIYRKEAFIIAITEASKQCKKNWDAANLTIIGCRATKEKAKLFHKACKAAGTNANAVLSATVNKFIEEHPVEESPEE